MANFEIGVVLSIDLIVLAYNLVPVRFIKILTCGNRIAGITGRSGYGGRPPSSASASES